MLGIPDSYSHGPVSHPWVTYDVILFPHQKRFLHCPHSLSLSPLDKLWFASSVALRTGLVCTPQAQPYLLLQAAECQVHTTVSLETVRAFIKQNPFVH